jgi:trehalose-6-phosphate synthase
MPKRERAARMRSLRRRVLENDVTKWSSLFLRELENRKALNAKGGK